MLTTILDYLDSERPGRVQVGPAILDGDRSFTLKEVERVGRIFGTHLLRLTEIRRRPIAVFLPKCAEVVFADLGILSTGNLFTNLDVKSPAQRIRNILDNLDPALVVTSRNLAPWLTELGLDNSRLVLVEDVLDGTTSPDDAVLDQRRRGILDTDPLCIINTSGSTGTPKGVVLHHRGLIDFMEWAFETLPLDGTERIGSLSPFHFDIYLLELVLCLARGATLVIIPEEIAAFPASLMRLLREREITFLFWVPTIMVTIANQGLLETLPVASLRTIFFAGEVFPTRHLNLWRKALPEAVFVNLYGPIEIHVDCTYFIVERKLQDDEPLPIGFPCRNTDILILDENDRPCPPGRQGELCVRGSSVAHGYWNDPEKTAQAFVQNPLQDCYPERIYRTGDLVYLNERGEIMFVGRMDYQIKHMGYRIELPEIEHQVLALPGIRNACVLYHRSRKEITLFYESAHGTVTPATLRLALAEVFPKYMIPTVFHQLETLPRNPNGKIDRHGLQGLLEERP
ncbi:amino acid adenylation domain-containing protein [Geothrix paludis]|uniref:amino acid adenylation domain-containing protein n=1 Tax=Geothrix paludis TaxID=2922722 RepID=UPI001FAC5766|nr:amino acid adenylation domain-containing protein [Geothrix paludis]